MWHEVDGRIVKMTDEEAKAALAEGARRQAEHVARKGHDCWDPANIRHEMFESYRGGLNDAYYCRVCGDLLQVG